MRQVVVTVHLYQELAGKKGFFCSQSAVFDGSERIEDVLRWAREYAAQVQKQVVRIEIAPDARDPAS